MRWMEVGGMSQEAGDKKILEAEAMQIEEELGWQLTFLCELCRQGDNGATPY